MCGKRSIILHDGPQVENRNLKSVCPDAESECPSASLNQCNTKLNNLLQTKNKKLWYIKMYLPNNN